MKDRRLSRRAALKIATSALGAAVLASCEPASKTTSAMPSTQGNRLQDSNTRMPTVFLPHGGGPWPFMDDAAFGAGAYDLMANYMRSLEIVPPVAPKALLVISAHWEEPEPTVMTGPKPPMLYDYHGFPPETYELQWPAPGAPEMAARVDELLRGAGFHPAGTGTRGFDHGVFVPLMLAYPDAAVPTFQLSLKAGLDPAEHFAMGAALAPLRNEGVFIIGSGMSYHNMRAFMARMRGGAPTMTHDSKAFDEWLAETMSLAPSQRQTRLIEWEGAPAARASHPREEHLLPLMVIAGAGGDDASSLPYRDIIMGAHVSAAHFG